ncbi:MAG: DUF4270 domain-containing protein [Bacteroides sp.]|nr:DUF4270 domain-containing protein [Bacteroides sp.]
MRKSIILILIIGITYSCQDENSSLGKSLVNSSFRNIITDTCTVSMSTLYVDSIETLGDSICQIGHYEDSIWGKITSSYYTEYSLASFNTEEDHSYKFDSITLKLVHSGNYWGDTLTQQRIYVYPIKYAISFSNDETMYNTSKIQTSNTPLFSFLFSPRPGRKKELEIRMPDSFGQKILDDIISEKEAFDSQDKFKAYFHGLAFVPENSDKCITGFQVNDTSMAIKLYYEDIYSQKVEKKLTFSPNMDYAYTRVDHDRTNTPIAALKSGNVNAVPSSKLNYRAYLQGLTGIYDQIEIPYLNNLMKYGDITSIESATLYLYPLANSYNKISQLPSELRLYVANDDNVLEDQIYESSGTTVQNGNLVTDKTFSRDTYYSFDITSFLQSNLGTMGMYRKKLLLNMTDNDFKSTFKQVIFTNQKNEDRQVKLEVRFKVYTEQ